MSPSALPWAEDIYAYAMLIYVNDMLQVSVTVHHDDEQVSSLTYASMDPFDPVMSFQDFIKDNESIVDEVCKK